MPVINNLAVSMKQTEQLLPGKFVDYKLWFDSTISLFTLFS